MSLRERFKKLGQEQISPAAQRSAEKQEQRAQQRSRDKFKDFCSRIRKLSEKKIKPVLAEVHREWIGGEARYQVEEAVPVNLSKEDLTEIVYQGKTPAVRYCLTWGTWRKGTLYGGERLEIDIHSSGDLFAEVYGGYNIQDARIIKLQDEHFRQDLEDIVFDLISKGRTSWKEYEHEDRSR